MADYRVSAHTITHPDEIAAEWRDLQTRAECSFFQSWGWMGTWLDEIAIEHKPMVVKVRSGQRVVGMGVFVRRELRRRLFVRSRLLLLNEYPFDRNNMVIEYNGLLADREHRDAVYDETLKYLDLHYPDIDEFRFGAVADIGAVEALRRNSSAGLRFVVDEESPAWQVDLSGGGAGVEGCLAGLSKNRRAQIRRSLRVYERDGPLQLVEAETPEQAIAFFEGLRHLHTARWQRKGKKGVFANPKWESFHRAMILNCFNAGEIQLLKIANAHETIGYLYNYIWRKRVYVVQTGFQVSEDKRLMPGYVTHAMAIAHNRAKGMSTYDLMHGESLYKRILCDQRQTLFWVVLQRRRLKFFVERFAVRVVRGYRSVRRDSPPDKTD